MIDERLTHDASWAAAYRMTEQVAPVLREEEQTKLFHEAYRIIRAAIEAYCIQLHRQQQRVEPSRN